MRAILLERGVIFPAGRRRFEHEFDRMLSECNETSAPRMQHLIGGLRAEWKEPDAKIGALNDEFVQLARNDAATHRLTSIPGIGVLNATALVTAVGDASSFAKARDLGSSGYRSAAIHIYERC